MPPALTIQNLQARYRLGSGSVVTIDNLIFDHARVIGVFGPNHIGKSTLLRALSGPFEDLVIAKDVAINVLGETLPALIKAGQLAAVSQRYAETLLPWKSLEWNIRLPLLAQGLETIELEEAVSTFFAAFASCEEGALYEKLGMSHGNPARSKPVQNMSGGQQQMVCVMRSLIQSPRFLIMDEPFSAIDYYHGATFRDYVLGYLERLSGVCVLVLHDLAELIRFSDYILFLKRENSHAIPAGVERIGEMKNGPNLSETEAAKLCADLADKYGVSNR